MAAVAPVFFDTSVWLGGLIDFGPESAPAQHVMDLVAEGRVKPLHTAWHCCLEFYSVATRLPAEFRLTPPDALHLIEREILSRCRVEQLPSGEHRHFLRSAARSSVIGGRVYDAHISEIARRAKVAMVVTDNTRHLTTLLAYGIRVLTTEEFARELGHHR